MFPLQSLVLWAALSGAVFPLPLSAQEEVTRGNAKSPHQPPAWFSRLASEPSPPRYVDSDSMTIRLPETFPGWIGRPSTATPKKACVIRDAQGLEKWAFCEL